MDSYDGEKMCGEHEWLFSDRPYMPMTFEVLERAAIIYAPSE